MGRGSSKIGGGGAGGGDAVEAKTYALFHGSPSTDIEEFDLDRAGENTLSGEKLLFFTDSRDVADEFSYERTHTDSLFVDQRGAKGRVYEVDVTMKKPLDFSNLSAEDVKNLKEMSRSNVFGELSDSDISTFSRVNNQMFKTRIDLDRLADFGYDGFIATMDRAGNKEYAVVSSSQVKIKK